jgi:hypothetical protein
MSDERIELLSEEPRPNRDRHMIQSLTLMMTFAWGLSGIHVVSTLVRRFKFTTVYCTSKIRQKIKDDPEQQGVTSA